MQGRNRDWTMDLIFDIDLVIYLEGTLEHRPPPTANSHLAQYHYPCPLIAHKVVSPYCPTLDHAPYRTMTAARPMPKTAIAGSIVAPPADLTGAGDVALVASVLEWVAEGVVDVWTVVGSWLVTVCDEDDNSSDEVVVATDAEVDVLAVLEVDDQAVLLSVASVLLLLLVVATAAALVAVGW